jgi:hypothetical protein
MASGRSRCAPSGGYVTSGRALKGSPSAYRCGGSSGWDKVCRTLTLLIPVELSRQRAKTSTNALTVHPTQRTEGGRHPTWGLAGGPSGSGHWINVSRRAAGAAAMTPRRGRAVPRTRQSGRRMLRAPGLRVCAPQRRPIPSSPRPHRGVAIVEPPVPKPGTPAGPPTPVDWQAGIRCTALPMSVGSDGDHHHGCRRCGAGQTTLVSHTRDLPTGLARLQTARTRTSSLRGVEENPEPDPLLHAERQRQRPLTLR